MREATLHTAHTDTISEREKEVEGEEGSSSIFRSLENKHREGRNKVPHVQVWQEYCFQVVASLFTL